MKTFTVMILFVALAALANEEYDFTINTEMALRLSEKEISCEFNYLRVPVQPTERRSFEIALPDAIWLDGLSPEGCETLKEKYKNQKPVRVDLLIKGSKYWETVRIGSGCGGTSDNHKCQELRTTAILSGRFENINFEDRYDSGWIGNRIAHPTPQPAPAPIRPRPIHHCHPMDIACDLGD